MLAPFSSLIVHRVLVSSPYLIASDDFTLGERRLMLEIPVASEREKN